MTHAATPAKLRSGAWGARVQGQTSRMVAAGDALHITARSGKSWTARVERVVWRGEDVVLVATSSGRSRGSSRSSIERTYMRRYGWDGVRGSSSYYTSGMYDEES